MFINYIGSENDKTFNMDPKQTKNDFNHLVHYTNSYWAKSAARDPKKVGQFKLRADFSTTVLPGFFIHPAHLQFKILDTEVKRNIDETGTGTMVTAFFSRYQ